MEKKKKQSKEFMDRLKNWGSILGSGKQKLDTGTELALQYDLSLADKVLEFKASKYWTTLVQVLDYKKNKAIALLSNPVTPTEDTARLRFILEDVQDTYNIFNDIIERGKVAQSQLEKFKEKDNDGAD